MSEVEHEQEAPGVADVPEPDQEPHEPVPDEADDEDAADHDEEQERLAEPGEDETPQARGPGEIPEKNLRAIANSFKTYTGVVERQMEAHAEELFPCPLCPEMHPGFLNIHDAGRVPDEITKSVFMFLGIAREQEYEPDPEAVRCAICKGKGKTRLPTEVAGKETRVCPGCNGAGYTGIASSAPIAASNGHADEPFSVVTDGPKELADADNWGQPRILPDGRENPNWGKMPQYWVQVEPWGDTRNLNALDAPAGA